MNTPQQEAIRRKLIEARQNTWFRDGERVYGKGSPITYRLLQFPSAVFRYTGIVFLDSGTWRTQKIVEILTRQDINVWVGSVTFKSVDHIQPQTLEQMKVFLETAFRSEERLFLDHDIGFWDENAPDWMLNYRSTAFIDLHVAEGTITRRGNPICRITVEGSALVQKLI